MTQYFHVLIYDHGVKTAAVSCHTKRPCQFSIEKARRTENENPSIHGGQRHWRIGVLGMRPLAHFHAVLLKTDRLAGTFSLRNLLSAPAGCPRIQERTIHFIHDLWEST